VGVVCSWRGLSIDGPLTRRPSSRPCQRANEEEEPASDAPCRGAPGPKPLKHRQNRFFPPFVKRAGLYGSKRLPSTGVHSPTAFAIGSDADPPPFLETLPSEAGFRRSFALRYDEEGLDSAASASSRSRALGAARRPSNSAIETFRKHDLGTDGTLA
jgi:hypothetical protein